MSQSTNTTTSTGYSVGDIVGVVGEAQTYKNLLYLFLAFPLGLFYFVFLTMGFALGLGLSVLLVGLGILLATVVGLRFVASFERWLANTLLDTNISDPEDVDRSGEVVDTVKAYLQAASTWKGLGFVFLKFWLGVVSFVLLITFLGVAIELLVLPLFPGGALNVQVGGFETAEVFDTTLERALAVPAGAVLAVFALHLLNAFARVNASIATSLLGPETPAGEEGSTDADDGVGPADDVGGPEPANGGTGTDDADGDAMPDRTA